MPHLQEQMNDDRRTGAFMSATAKQVLHPWYPRKGYCGMPDSFYDDTNKV